MNPANPNHLQLERRRANLHFCSWRLSSSILRSQGTVPLPAPALPAQTSETDHVAVRHAALLNGITQQPHGCYTFLDEEASLGDADVQPALYEVDVGEALSAPQLRRVCGLPSVQQALPAGGLTSGSLPPSVAEVQTASPAAEASAGDVDGGLLLVSGGHGDISLVQRVQQQPVTGSPLSAPVFPLRPPPPMSGALPLHLLAAYQLPQQACTGVTTICCICWAPRPRSGQHPSRCEVFAMLLAAQLGAAPALQVAAVQLLQVSDLPPHGVLVNPSTGGVLLALQPSSPGVEEEAAAQRAAAAAAAPQPAAVDGDEGDISPRTLQAAVARLAAHTSEEPVGPLPHQQYADLYREAGADGLGAMGGEPVCALYTFVPASSGQAWQAAPQQAAVGAAAQEGAGRSQEASSEQGAVLRLAHVLSCQPHRLLTCHLEGRGAGPQEPPTPDTHAPHGAEQQTVQAARGAAAAGPRLLLGLTDDVDCAVVAVSALPGGSGGDDGGAGFAVEHVSSLPALAYVAAGKVQRKFLLLAPPGAAVCAALVEAAQYAYLYRSVEPRQEYGEHQVVDMELPDSARRGLLGAVLLRGRAGACRLLLLAREGLRVLDV